LLFAAYGIGANDLANAFGSSVGSKALTIKQAVCIAAVFEFAGAFSLGSHVTETVRKGIADPSAFYDRPEIYMYGMLAVIASVGMWLILATYFELPVSTTHSCIGGVVGFALTAGGKDAVIWYKEDTSGEKFPIGGLTGVVLSWVISPVACGLLSAGFFWIARFFILEHENSYERSFWGFPPLVFVAVFINVFLVAQKGSGDKGKKDMTIEKAAWIGAAVAAGCTVLAAIFSKYYLRNIVERSLAAQAQADADKKAGVVPEDKKSSSFFKSLSRGLDQNVHDVIDEDEDVGAVHSFTAVYDPKTEETFKYLQVFTAICDSFSHGSNDVANSVGPLAGIYLVYKVSFIPTASKKTSLIEDDMYWILALGGVGIVLGLSTYGYIIMRAIGVKLSKITPSRGFAIEIGSAMIVALGSKYGLPLSTTHCQVGSTIGVGLMEGVKGVNWSIVPRIVAGWIVTLIVAGLSTSLLFSQGAFAPNMFLVAEKKEMRFYTQAFVQERAATYMAYLEDQSGCTTAADEIECDAGADDELVAYKAASLIYNETARMMNPNKVQKVNQDMIGYMLCKAQELDNLMVDISSGPAGYKSTYGKSDVKYTSDVGKKGAVDIQEDKITIMDLKGNDDFCAFAEDSITDADAWRENTCSGGCADVVDSAK